MGPSCLRRQVLDAPLIERIYAPSRNPNSCPGRICACQRPHRRCSGLWGQRLAGAWKAKPRDRVIGWTTEPRQYDLHLIVHDARFPILPWIHCQSLDSRILGLAAKRLADDWRARSRYRPVVFETFVEKPPFTGTCHKTAHWQNLGVNNPR
ncbi:MAG: Druantia anti-phage system protein DruA [Acidiferrobacter sp.]